MFETLTNGASQISGRTRNCSYLRVYLKRERKTDVNLCHLNGGFIESLMVVYGVRFSVKEKFQLRRMVAV